MTTTDLHAIPTNIITGFLGAGKTTAILQLLENKPPGERWAVLVNEFGEVGIDGALLSAAGDGVFIREVPGGCMCCANGVPVQIALNRLLSKARPHRLLIEPTGLGHPQEIIALLRSDLYRQVLNLRTTLVMVDARNLMDERYLASPIFMQQLKVADVVIGNKQDLYSAEDQERLSRYVHSEFPQKSLHFAVRGKFDSALLDAHTDLDMRDDSKRAHTGQIETPFFLDLPERMPACGYLHRTRQSNGYFSCGWVFSPEWIFEYDQLFSLLSSGPEARLKGVFITDQGVFAYNRADEILTEAELDDALDSRIEIIDRTEIRVDEWQSGLMSATIHAR